MSGEIIATLRYPDREETRAFTRNGLIDHLVGAALKRLRRGLPTSEFREELIRPALLAKFVREDWRAVMADQGRRPPQARLPSIVATRGVGWGGG